MLLPIPLSKETHRIWAIPTSGLGRGWGVRTPGLITGAAPGPIGLTVLDFMCVSAADGVSFPAGFCIFGVAVYIQPVVSSYQPDHGANEARRAMYMPRSARYCQ